MILKTGFEWYYKRKEDSQWKYPSVNDISNERLIIVMILGTLALLLHSTSQTELDSYLEYLKNEAQNETNVEARWSIFENLVNSLYAFDKTDRKIKPHTINTFFLRMVLKIFLGVSGIASTVFKTALHTMTGAHNKKGEFPTSFLVIDVVLLVELLFHCLNLHKESPVYGSTVSALKLMFPGSPKIDIYKYKKNAR